MIDFRPLELEDRELVQRYTFKSTRRNCDLSFSNLYSWQFVYQTQIAEKDGFLLFRFYLDDTLAYMMPVGDGDLKNIIPQLMEDADRQGHPFKMWGICAQMKPIFEEAFPDTFELVANPNNFDYIYTHETLATLRGKKLQSKRNHLNKFRAAHPDAVFKPLTPELVPDCLRLEAEWCKANDCAENESLQRERIALTRALKSMDELGLMGGVLYVDGKIAAFTFGCPINEFTFDTCVEKADTDIEGTYAMINYEFANYLPEKFRYINREEDLGLEGLRKAKLSYQPETILEKYTATLK